MLADPTATAADELGVPAQRGWATRLPPHSVLCSIDGMQPPARGLPAVGESATEIAAR